MRSGTMKEGYWYCTKCKAEVEPRHVTFWETHDERFGGCGCRLNNSKPVEQIERKRIMSGGAFGYAYQTVENFSEDLRTALGENRDSWDDNTLQELEALVKAADSFSFQMKDAEWLCSGDIGEEEFCNRQESRRKAYAPPR
jgi:hypothetical protein